MNTVEEQGVHYYNMGQNRYYLTNNAGVQPRCLLTVPETTDGNGAERQILSLVSVLYQRQMYCERERGSEAHPTQHYPPPQPNNVYNTYIPPPLVNIYETKMVLKANIYFVCTAELLMNLSCKSR